MEKEYCVYHKREDEQRGGKYCVNNHFVCKSAINANSGLFSSFTKCPVCKEKLK